MTLWVQHTLVLGLVLFCVIFVARGLMRTFSGKRSRMGNCCAKGCSDPTTAHSAPAAGQVVFVPSSALRVRR
ncbi:MAG: hypothetical protein IT448_03670 [Phycisphaerales bacterium]|nr:hypothetical protein [Phycisphaerales bacterium]